MGNVVDCVAGACSLPPGRVGELRGGPRPLRALVRAAAHARVRAMQRALLVMTCVGLGLANPARAQPTPTPRSRPRLVVRAAEACPAGSRVDARFAAVLEATEREEGEVHVQIDASPAGFVLHFSADLPEGRTERELEDPDCGALLTASVLLTAIALDVPLETVMELEEPTAPHPEADPLAQPDPLEPDDVVPLEEPDPAPQPAMDLPGPRWLAWAHASVGLGSRFLPALRPDGGAGLALFQARARAAFGLVGALRWSGPEASSAERDGVRVRARALGGQLGLCLRRTAAPWALDGCAGGRAWRVRGEGVGSDADRRDNAADVALWAQLGVTLRLHPRVGLRAAFGGAAHLLRARLNVTGVGVLHTVPALQLEGSLALWVRLNGY